MPDFTYRLTETKRYPLGSGTFPAIYMIECSDKKESIEVVVSPEMGMSLLSFSIKHVSLLAKSRTQDFIDGRKGLGPLILPHFSQRDFPPSIPEEILSSFGHVGYLRKHSVKDPFQHGAGRYASWEYETKVTDTYARVAGHITGKTELNGLPLSAIVGFDFSALVTYTLCHRSLAVKFDVSGTEPVVAGIHFYYRLPENRESVVALSVENKGINEDDSVFGFSEHAKDKKYYNLPLSGGLDVRFSPVSAEGDYAIYKLITPEYRLDTKVLVQGSKEETFDSVVVFHPEKSDFVCIEPLSDKYGSRPEKKRISGEIFLHPLLI